MADLVDASTKGIINLKTIIKLHGFYGGRRLAIFVGWSSRFLGLFQVICSVSSGPSFW